MKRFLTGIALFLTMAAFSLSGQGVAMPFYTVDVELECASAEKAAAAELKFLPLPEGKEAAFSCRWDDSSLSHQRTLDLMKKHNYKGTFYLTGGGRKEFWEKVFPNLCKDGFAVGNHTLSHKHLPFLTPETIHHEILWWNILLECRANAPVTILVIPFGKIDTPYFGKTSQLIGSSLQRTGIIGGADISPKLYARYGLPANEFFTPRLIAPGDREPDCKRFDAQIARHLNSSDKPLYLTLGIHSLHTDKGLVQLGKSLAKYGNNPNWWYCTAGDYSAYRFMALNSRIKSKKVQGKRVRFGVELPDPAFLGSVTPLWGTCDGKTFAIPHTRKLPGKIALADPTGKNEKFPALVTALGLTSSGALTFNVKNSGAPLESVILTFRLPPAYDFVAGDGTKKGVYQIHVDKIGESFSCMTPAALPNGKVQIGAGMEIKAVQMDFTCGRERGRIWNALSEKREEEGAENYALSFSTKSFSVDEAKALSTASKSSDNSFRVVKHLENWRSGAYQLRLDPKKDLGKKLTVMMGFQGKGKMTLRGDLPETVYCSGKTLKAVKGSVELGELQGDCRVVLVYPPQTRSQKNLVLLLKED